MCMLPSHPLKFRPEINFFCRCLAAADQFACPSQKIRASVVMSQAGVMPISFKHVPETSNDGLGQGSESRIDPLMVGLEIADR
jgi:hypothetical protein